MKLVAYLKSHVLTANTDLPRAITITPQFLVRPAQAGTISKFACTGTDYLLKVCYASYEDSACGNNVTPLEPVNRVYIHKLTGIKTITL